MNRAGIKSRMIVLALIPTALIAMLLAWLYISSRVEDMEREIKDRGQAIARQLAPACEYGVFSNNRTLLATLANSALKEADVIAVSIFDAQGKPLAAARARITSNAWLNLFNPDKIYQFRAAIVPTFIGLDDIASPPTSPTEENVLGEVIIELTNRSTALRQQQTLFSGLALALSGMLFTSLLALRIARGVTDPIVALARAAALIKGGVLDTRVVPTAGGELGELQHGINAMAAALHEAQLKQAKLAEDTLFAEQMRAQVTLQSLGEGVITTDAQMKVLYLNTVAEKLTGWTRDEAINRSINEIFIIQDEQTGVGVPCSVARCLSDGEIVCRDSHHKLIRRDGSEFSIRDTVSPIRDRDGKIIGTVVVFHDVTELRRMAQQVVYQATHDALTGLLNRREFECRLAQALASARDQGAMHALCYLDLDQFKMVNDTCGHMAGDELLKQLAEHLRAKFSETNALARLGGDEFAVLLENCSIDQAAESAEKLRREILNFRFTWQNRSFEIGVSIGVVAIAADSGTLSDLMSAADTACYVAKDRGRNRIHVHQAGDRRQQQRQGEMHWARRLQDALEHNTLQLYAQAIHPVAASLAQQPLSPHYEITVMMRDEISGENISPALFIPAAERYHLMPALDRWVVNKAMGLLAEYPLPQQNENYTFALNLSGQTLCDDHFLKFILGRLDEYQIPARWLCFEITETAAITHLTRAIELLNALKKRGCRFALDDFGSGLSSFGYLRKLAVDHLKIDGSFIKDIVHDQIDCSMVEAINEIGHVMGLTTIAEFVENAQIYEKLRTIGVDYGQGYWLERPQPLIEILAALTASSSTASNIH